jgi:GAF domain-containing protein/ligand-binding sensor domain-containing protein
VESRERVPFIFSLCFVLLLIAALVRLATPALSAELELSSPTGMNTGAGGGAQDITFRRLTLTDGLSQSSINCIVQDAQGFMWFGTQDGLNRYDGYEIKVYRNDPEDSHSLSDSWVTGCRRDERDVVWFLTGDGTVNRYEPEGDRFVRYSLAMEDPFQMSGSGFTTLRGDAQGRLWIGTFGSGLFRYDPTRDSFRSYQHDPADPTSLSHRIVWHVYEDAEGAIWVGTEAGLNRYDPESDSFMRYPYRDFPPGGYHYDPPVHDYDLAFQPDNPDALGSPAVTYLLQDGDGRLWVGTRYGGLNWLDEQTGRFTSYPYDPAFEPEDPSTFSGNSVRVMVEDRRGQIWVSSAHWNLDETRTYARLGLERLDPETGRITRYPADADSRCSLSHDAVRRIYEDDRGTLWFHTFAGGLDVYDWETGCFDHYVHDPDDPESLSGDSITRFYEDEAGGLWIGTGVSGVNLFDPTWSKFPSYCVSASGSEYLSNNSIWAFGVSPENLTSQGRARALWVSTSAGVNYWDRRANTFTFYEIAPQLPDNQAYAILEDTKRDTLWLATSMGLERAALPAEVSAAPEVLDFTRILTRSSAAVGYVLDLHPAGADQLWVPQYRVGLHRFDLATEEIVDTYRHDPDDDRSLGDDRVNRIFPGRDETLWLVTASGLEHFDPTTGVFTQTLHDPDDPESVAERVMALYEDEAGGVWLGTQSDGLQRLDPATGQVTATYGEGEGLPNDVVYGVLPDGAGHLWLSTNQGLARFDPATETFQSYTSADGLQSNEFNYGAQLRAPDGELFFGGVNGINAFYPQEIAPNAYVPPVAITDIRLGPPRPPRGASVPGSASLSDLSSSSGGSEALLETPPNFTEEIELSFRDRVLSFEFAALHYAMPERNQYAYMLEGFDRDWNYVGNRRFATYTNLPPGSYVFRVRGSNSDGVWNEEGASLIVTVRPPFWSTWWFRGLIAVALIGSAVGGYRLRVRSIRTRSRELETEVAGRTKELASLNAIAAVVSRSLDLDQMLADALDETLEVTGIEAGGIYLLDEETGVLTIAVQQGFSPEFATAIDRLSVGEGFSGRVAGSGAPLVVTDVSEDARLTRMMVQEEGLHSLAVVPLSTRGRVLGTLFVVTRGHRDFTDRDVELLTSIGQQIGVAVENARLYEDTRRRLAQLTALQETTTAVAGTLELERLLRLIVHDAVNLLEAEGGILNLVDWDTREDEVVAAAGVAADTVGHRSGLEAGLSGWVALHDKAVVANNVRADERVDRPGLVRLESESGRRLENAAAAPLRIKDRVVGTLVILDKQGGKADFDQSDLNLLQAFANQAATAIENARLFEAEQRRAEQFRGITEVGRRISSVLDLDELLQAVVHLIKEIFGYYNVNIFLTDHETNALLLKAGLGGYVNDIPPLGSGIDSDQEGIVRWIAATGEPLLVNDVSIDPRYYATPELPDTRSELGVPIRVRGEVVGTLDVQSTELNAFDEHDLITLQNMADQIGIAVANARLFEAEQRRAEQFRVISEVGRRTTSILSIGELLNEMVLLIQDSFDYDIVEIGLVEGEELVFKAGVDRGSASPFPGFRILVGKEGITGRVAATGEPLLVPDVSQDERFVQFTDTDTRTCSELAVPIKTKERIVGVLNVQSAQLDAFDESDLAVMQALADQAATAIENARLFEAEQRRVDQFRVISEVGRRITSIMGIDSVLQQVAELVQSTLDYDHVGIALIEDAGDQGVHAVYRVGAGELWKSPDFEFSPASLKVGEEGVTGWVAATGEPLLVSDVREDPRYVWMRESRTLSELAVPIKLKGKVIGVLDAQSNQVNAFDESDLSVLQSLADQAAIAIENARLYERASQLAVVEERQRLARELHDSVTQALYGTTLYAEAAARQLATGQVELASQHLQELRDTAQEALREMRLLIFELRPSILESEGLVNALRARLEAVEGRAGLAVEFYVEGETTLPTAVEEGLYRIAQEALNNTLKHACARRVSVSLNRGERAVVLEIVDDGCGFDPSTAVPGGGLGLDGMIERAAKMGGELVLDSEPGGGTRVLVEVPQ